MLKAFLKRVTGVEERERIAAEAAARAAAEAAAQAEAAAAAAALAAAEAEAATAAAAAAAAAQARFDAFQPPYRLHLGCGGIRLEGFCNVDAMDGPAVDVVDDIRTLERFPDGSVEEIYTCHVLEHFGHDEVPPLLQRWRQLLQPGGKLRISVPDMDRIVRIYMKNWAHFQKPGHTPWIGLIYGGQTTPYDFHKTGFNACWLRYLLESNGFTQCEEYPHDPHFVPGTMDNSLAHEPFGEFLSLNMIAVRAEHPVVQAAEEPVEVGVDSEAALVEGDQTSLRA